MLELLAPAGSPEAVTAAVQSGANAVYLGYGDFNARRNAKNFSAEEFAAAVSYCHLRGVKVYLTLNTLVSDREMDKAAAVAQEAFRLGVDAVLVQDLGVVRMLRQCVPDLPIHASTQMTVHNLEGVLRCADLGLSRVVLARELPREAIGYICQHSPIEIEVFVHGALCMCYSGQCYFSALIGRRSGNRGLCAQPCRMAYGWGGRADGHPLSLKDLSLVNYLRELEEMGVACIKIEGRMKRPEYVAAVTSVYAAALEERREPTREEMKRLEAVFSRQGFTDGYYTDRQGPHMFGTRQEGEEPVKLYAQVRNAYLSGETRRVPVTFYAMIRASEPAQVGVEDEEGRVATAAGPVPEAARTHALTTEVVEEQLSKTGGTPYLCKKVRALVEPGLSLPLSALNALRRQVLEELSVQRTTPPPRRQEQFHPGVRYENRREGPILTISLRRHQQLTGDLLALKPALLYLPLEELIAYPEMLEQARQAGVEVAAILPRIAGDGELGRLRQELERVRQMGVTQVLTGEWGLSRLAGQAGFTLRGDFGLNVFNSLTLKQMRRMGFASATVSFELKLPQIRDLSKAVDTEMIVYGRLPLMITENCILRSQNGICTCENVSQLTDRTLAQFPVVKARGCRNELLNAKKLFLADKKEDYQSLGLWGVRLMFTTENPRECVQVTERYLGRGSYEPNDYTRGLYYRGVE